MVLTSCGGEPCGDSTRGGVYSVDLITCQKVLKCYIRCVRNAAFFFLYLKEVRVFLQDTNCNILLLVTRRERDKISETIGIDSEYLGQRYLHSGYS